MKVVTTSGHRRHSAGPVEGGQYPGFRGQEGQYPGGRYPRNQCWPGGVAGRAGSGRRPARSALAGAGDTGRGRTA